MRCPRCHSSEATHVTNIRHRSDGTVRRRHACRSCSIRWTTLEFIVLGTAAAKAPGASLTSATADQTPGADG
jgi:transcriptional regulator NrdR family protein